MELLSILLITCIIVTAARSATFNTEEELISDLISNYGSTSLRPVKNQTQAVLVTLRAPPTAVFEFAELEQNIQFQSYFRLVWRDEKLTWDPDEYNGVKMVELLRKNIWVPHLSLLENLETTTSCPLETIMRVSHNGEVVMSCIVITSTFCQILVKYFPFDYQHCSLTYMSWVYDVSKIELEVSEDTNAFEDEILSNGIWDLAGLEIEHFVQEYNCSDCHYGYSQIRYTVELRRTQSLFYGINILLPSFLLSFMNILVFRLPPDCGEKISFVMTNVLALILFQQLVSDSLPPAGNDHPVIGKHISLMIVSGCIAIVWTVFVLNLYHKRKPFPVRVAYFFRSRLGRFVTTILCFECIHLRKSKRPDRVGTRLAANSGEVKSYVTVDNCGEGNNQVTLGAEETHYPLTRKMSQKVEESDILKWQEYALFLDWLMAIIVTVFNLVLYCIIIVTILTQNPDEYHHGGHEEAEGHHDR
ncbi:Neuronal acetylcholine receptor subunit alpha-9-II [Holothuria leucospilota]|uniref:Neuronal acetylcholine receptor subunit alpha-9-II n=1 Tax=Holothuria leucospilota TaxID=206669 RepID=A0A9Q1BS11_HOLLE|nr:Neuronal acetylcholine receptor subunit alpha-9-II [Holothuria leucospilota]